MAATQRDFLNRLATLAKVCEFNGLTRDLIALYDRALSRFGYPKATAAIEAAIMERKGTDRMPSIADLVNRCQPSVNEADVAVETAGRILEAITKFGYPNPVEAQKYIGEVGWHVVVRNGGWRTLCENMRESAVPTWKAQLREQAMAALRLHKAGQLHKLPSFETREPDKNFSLMVGDIVKTMEEKSDSRGTDRAVPPEPSAEQQPSQGHAGLAAPVQGTAHRPENPAEEERRP